MPLKRCVTQFPEEEAGHAGAGQEAREPGQQPLRCSPRERKARRGRQARNELLVITSGSLEGRGCLSGLVPTLGLRQGNAVSFAVQSHVGGCAWPPAGLWRRKGTPGKEAFAAFKGRSALEASKAPDARASGIQKTQFAHPVLAEVSTSEQVSERGGLCRPRRGWLCMAPRWQTID